MLIIEHTIETKASKEVVWRIWQDIKNWNTWDLTTEYSSIDGPFSEGTQGRLKPKDGPILPLKLVQVEPLKKFTVEFKLFFARLLCFHSLTELRGKTSITIRMEIKGPLAFLFVSPLGNALKKSLPKEMEALVKKAESSTSSSAP